MKKILLLILAICSILSASACGSEKKAPDPLETAKIKAWAFHSYEKTIVNVAPKGTLATDYTVYLAKSETEGCQVAVYSDTDFKNVTFKLVSGGAENIEPSVYVMSRTHKIVRKQYTDALIPYNGEKLTLQKRIALPFMVEFKTNENTEAGEYKYTYELQDRKGKAIASFDITVHVWDVTLPAEKTFATAAGLSNEGIYYHGGTYLGWYNVLLDHNVSAYTLPYDILDEKANAYMSDPRVTSFMINVTSAGITTNKLLEIYEKLKNNPEWLEKAYFYPLDEPRTKQHLVELRGWEKRLSALCPEIDICAPYYTNIQLGEGKDQTDDMAEYTDLWCPKLCLWDDRQSYADLNYTPSKTFHERMNDQIASGDRMWTYVCNSPDDPYAQMFIDTEGVNQRLMFWQMYQRDIEGFLYWSTNSYGKTKHGVRVDPWESTNTGIPGENQATIYGCGFLLYPGREIGMMDCIPSIRLKIVRDGIDDIELFYLAEQYLGKEWLLEKTYEGTPTLTEYVGNDEFASLRIEIGNALETALKK